MKMEEIRFLAELMRDTGLTALELEEGDTTLKLERGAAPAPVAAVPVVAAPVAAAPVAPVPAAAPAPEAAPAPSAPAGEETAGGIEVKSPMVGVFYSAAEPGAAPFVSAGTQVKKGDVLCIIEAMKLMNEITAERDGTITQVCCGNGQMVEFGQTLFRMEEG